MSVRRLMVRGLVKTITTAGLCVTSLMVLAWAPTQVSVPIASVLTALAALSLGSAGIDVLTARAHARGECAPFHNLRLGLALRILPPCGRSLFADARRRHAVETAADTLVDALQAGDVSTRDQALAKLRDLGTHVTIEGEDR